MSKQSDDKKENAASKKDDAVPQDSAVSKDKTDKGKDVSVKKEEPHAVAKVSAPKETVSRTEGLKQESAPEQKAEQKTAKNETAKNETEKNETAKNETAKTSTEKPDSKKGDAAPVSPTENNAKSSKEHSGSAKEAAASVPAKNLETSADKDVQKKDAAKKAEKSDISKTEGAKAATKDAAKTETQISAAKTSAPKQESTKSEGAEDGHVKSAIKNDISKKRDDTKTGLSITQDAAAKNVEDEKKSATESSLSSQMPDVEKEPDESQHTTSTAAQNIFPENVPVRNISGLLEPTMPPSGNTVDTYATVAAAADESGYESHKDVISSVQNILKPKGEFLSRAELLEASKQLRKVMPYNFEAWRLHADILLNALRQLETRQIMPDESFQILAIPLRENDIRDAAESALRQCAHFAPNEHQRISLVDEANSVRRITMF